MAIAVSAFGGVCGTTDTRAVGATVHTALRPAPPPAPAPPAETTAIAQTFRMALAGSPSDYLFHRGQIIAAGEAGSRFLKRIQGAKEESWLARELAAAILQRIERPEEVQLLEQAFQGHGWWGANPGNEPTYRSPYGLWGRGRIVRQGSQSVPFLIERLFKQPRRAIADRSHVGYHLSNPRGTASGLLRMIGGKTAARAMGVFLLTAAAPDQVLKAARLTDQQLVDRMISALRDDEKRSGAVWVLGELRDRRAVAPLIATLTDYHLGQGGPFVADALAKIGEPALPAVAQALRSSRRKTQCCAAAALGRMGEIAIPTLEEAFETAAQTPSVHVSVVRALRGIGGPKVVPLLIKALESPDAQARGHAAQALGEIGDQRGREPLLRALARSENHNQTTLFPLAAALGKLKERRALEPLMSLALHQDWMMRRAAIQGLELLGDPAAVPLLVKCLRHDTFSTRGDAAQALGRIGDPTAVPDLVVALNDSTTFVRSWSVWALGELLSAPAEALIRVAESDPDANVRRVAKEALQRIEARAGKDEAVPAESHN